jgi:hypothetical protein
MRPFKNRFLFFFLAVSLVVSAQNKEGYMWYFGNYAGLDFSTSPPTIITNNTLATSEGGCSIADANGNLLFYTDGQTVINKNHVAMANGSGLTGNWSTTQSCIIVKQPGSNQLYYVFTQDDLAGPDGLRYSIVDMSLAAGLGSVTAKNVPLYTPSCEKITATRHCNGRDFWVVSHDWYTNVFRSYLLTPSGLVPTPVLSSCGSIITGGSGAYQTLGQMKISPTGRKLGLVSHDLILPLKTELFDFNPATGVVSNPLTLNSMSVSYGCEFSPDGTKFYAAPFQGGYIFQWDLCAGSGPAIIASMDTLKPGGLPNAGWIGTMQLAPDGKIYIARVYSTTLSVIQNPNAAGSACNFVDRGQPVVPKQSYWGLPNLIGSQVLDPVTPFTHSIACSSATFVAPTVFKNSCLSTVLYSWKFGDPLSGSADSSSMANVTHTFSTPGTHTVQLVIIRDCYKDTIRRVVNVPIPVIIVTGVPTLCVGDTRAYVAKGADTFTWSTGSTSYSTVITHSATSVFTVTGTDTLSGCQSHKTFTVTVLPCTGLQSDHPEASITVFPNPFEKTLNIQTEADILVAIKDAMGRTLLVKEIPKGTSALEIESLDYGLYFLEAESSQTKVRFAVVRSR